jgi:NAD(P)-dependent dehydrogenase (short-subunit alcohol dehydrogenase family)
VSLFDLTGKVAVVTGSSRGIGRAIVERMAEQGAQVVVSSRNIEPCREVAATINAKFGDGRAVAIAANISAKDQLKALVDETMRAFGRIDVLICNAASSPHYGPMHTVTDEQFRKTLDNNIISNHWLITLVAPQMIARKDGAIIIVSSVGGFKGSPGSAPIASPRRPISSSRAISRLSSDRTMCGSIASRRAWFAPTSRARCGKIPTC